MGARAAPRVSKRALHRSRVPPDARRRQLLAVAAQLLTQQGVEQVQITEVAERAGVSRPLVYRQFPTRQLLVRAVLEDFAAFLNQRFQQVCQGARSQDAQTMATAFVEASCDAIEQKGAGAWLLLDPRGADAEMSRLGRAIFVALLDPWQTQLGTYLGVSSQRASHLLWIIVAAGRAALVGWIEGVVTREQAVRDAIKVVTSLLNTFTEPARRGER